MHSILLLHDDAAVAEALADVIRAIPRIQFAGWAHNLVQARERMEQGTPDLVLAKLRLPDGWATRLMDELRGPGRKGGPLLVVLADGSTDPNLMLALRHGADGYAVQGGTRETIAQALRLVLGGGSPMSPEIAGQVLAHFDATSPLHLTPDERWMLDCIVAGHLPHQIARNMGRSEAQVNVRIRNVYRKLQFELRAGSLQLVPA
jgi:DNA-binding NarL/FixJ family response regulator